MAAVDYYLKVDGIDGESTDDKHKGEIDIDSWSAGATNMGSAGRGGGAGAGKVQFQDVHFVTKTSKASPKLMLACAEGTHIKKAVLTCRKAGGGQQDYLVITLEDCLVTSYQTGGASESVLPTDQFSVNFAKFTQEYKEQKADGSTGAPVKAGYDVGANKKL